MEKTLASLPGREHHIPSRQVRSDLVLADQARFEPASATPGQYRVFARLTVINPALTRIQGQDRAVRQGDEESMLDSQSSFQVGGTEVLAVIILS